MSLLTRDEILSASDIETEEVEVSEWGGTVRVRGLSIAEAEEWSDLIEADEGRHYVNVKLLALTIVDEEGERIFTPTDIEALASRSAKATLRVVRVAKELSGLGKDAEEEIAGNSAAGPGDDSASD